LNFEWLLLLTWAWCHHLLVSGLKGKFEFGLATAVDLGLVPSSAGEWFENQV
jgi:hypothetical protein